MVSRPEIDPNRVNYLDIGDENAGQRLDNFLIGLFKGVPRSRIYSMIRKGEVRVNRSRVGVHYKLRVADRLRLPPTRVAAEQGQLPVGAGLAAVLTAAVLYEDDALMVLDKPAGLAVHGGSGVSQGLIEALRLLRADQGLELVHRLDRETSGCLIVSKKRAALRRLHAAMASGEIGKFYLALAVGAWPRDGVDVRAPLRKNVLASGERMVVVARDGRACHTRFEVLQRCAGATLLQAEPVTGRTHQIRVHARFVGCPLVGDEKYGDDEANKRFRALGCNRLFLHARRLRFTTPDGDRRVEVEAPLPQPLPGVLERIGCGAVG